MRNIFHSRKTRHIVKFSSLIFTALLSCENIKADESSSKAQVAIPAADTTSFIYNGGLQTYTLPKNANYSIFGNEHTTAGTHEVTVVLDNSTATEWEDGTVDPKTYEFVIKKQQLGIPAADTSKFVYNGAQQAYTIAENENYTVDGYNRTDAGNHEVTVTLNDSVNYEWSDATTEDKIYNFAIGKASVEIPAADTNKFTFNGSILVYEIVPNLNYKVSGNAQTTAGQHIVTVSLTNPSNYQWTDGTSDPKTFSFDVAKATVELPTAVKDTFEYDGSAKHFEVAYNNLYSVGINNETKSEVGAYERIVSINDTDNYIWADSTSEPKSVTFVIVEGKVKIPEAKDFIYSGVSTELIPQNPAYTVENGTATNVGDHNVKVTLNPGYVWENGTKDTIDLTVKINPILVEKPSVESTSVTYDSTIYSIKVPENPAYTISGKAIGIYPGTYTTALSLKPNYAWSDGTTENIVYSLTIERVKIAIPSEDTTIHFYSKKEQTYLIAENSNYTVEGDKQIEIGTYDVVVTLSDTTYYEWTDSSTMPKHYQFDIVECEKFDFDVTGSNTNIAPGEDLTIDLNIDGLVQYFKVSCAQLPELSDSLREVNSESSQIKIPTSSNITPGNYKMNVTLVAGNIDTTFTVDVTINYPASAIIVCWNDVIAVDKSKVKTTTYQWYKDGELIPEATGQYYSDKEGLCGYYMCVVDGGLTVGPVHLDFGSPLYLTAHGESGKIIASVVGKSNSNVLLMSVNGMVIETKPAATEMTFTVKPGIYVLALDGTDQSVKVVVK